MIQRSTFDFLSKLKKNNNKIWFDANRAAYETAKSDFLKFVESLIVELSKFDPAIKHLDPKKCIFRINRDIRFSKDKTPYKTNMGASISPGGKGSFSAGYYVHVEPGSSFLAGGMWHPEPALLAAIRQEIDYNADEFKKILNSKAFKKHFGALDEEDKLKTVPKGYDKNHPEIELLKHRNFDVMHNLKDKEVLSKDFLKNSIKVYKSIYPLDLFLRRACD